MFAQLAIATGMILLTVVIHAAGLMVLRRIIGLEIRGVAVTSLERPTLTGIVITLTVVLGVFALHGVEIWLYAGLYWWLDALTDFREAVYFSTITYSTIGYDDEGVERSWELIAAIEGINGIVLLGWSTAFFVSIGNRFARR